MNKNTFSYEAIWECAIKDFVLPEPTEHGPSHWKRVEQNGLILAQKNGAREDVVRLFAVFHDSKRRSEFDDPDHGRRGADFAKQLRNVLYQIDDTGFDLLYKACEIHTSAKTCTDITIGTCLDADRLDLGRVGIEPDEAYMSTEYGRLLTSR